MLTDKAAEDDPLILYVIY